MIAIGLSKEHSLAADSKTVQQVSFTENLVRAENTMLFIIEEAKETKLNFSDGTVRVLYF